MPNNKEFETCSPAPSPYVFMQPIDDSKAGHDLIKFILEHRVTAILLSRGFCFQGNSKHLRELQKEFCRLKADLKLWAWPKTSRLDHFSKTKEDQNKTVYTPPSAEENTPAPAIWNSFVVNLSCLEGSTVPAALKKRLPIFHSFEDKAGVFGGDLPRLQGAVARSENKMVHLAHSNSMSETVWRELLLGEGGHMTRAIESRTINCRSSTSCSPVSVVDSFLC